MVYKYHTLITSGNRVNSLRDERRTFIMKFSDRPAEEFFKHAWNAIKEFYEDKYGPLNIEYIFDNYNPIEYCNRGGFYCPRHETVFEVPIGNVSNREYTYIVKETPEGYNIDMYVGASGWEVYIDKDKAVIKRPNGRKYVYRNYGPISSYAYILAKFADALRFWQKLLDAARRNDRRKMLELGFGNVKVYEGTESNNENQCVMDFQPDELKRYAEEWMQRWREKNEKRKQPA